MDVKIPLYTMGIGLFSVQFFAYLRCCIALGPLAPCSTLAQSYASCVQRMDRFCSDWLKPTKTDSKTRIITISRLLRILVENIQVPNLDKAATRTKNSSPTYSSCQSIS